MDGLSNHPQMLYRLNPKKETETVHFRKIPVKHVKTVIAMAFQSLSVHFSLDHSEVSDGISGWRAMLPEEKSGFGSSTACSGHLTLFRAPGARRRRKETI